MIKVKKKRRRLERRDKQWKKEGTVDYSVTILDSGSMLHGP